uniref:Uncharacterized protein n=1 Tax=Rhizophora mucronata TaxID=61149 RepID=A0A2P2QRR7_RHIMU
MNTLYDFLLPRVLGHSANASCGKVVVSWLHTSQAAESFITRLQVKHKP